MSCCFSSLNQAPETAGIASVPAVENIQIHVGCLTGSLLESLKGMYVHARTWV